MPLTGDRCHWRVRGLRADGGAGGQLGEGAAPAGPPGTAPPALRATSTNHPLHLLVQIQNQITPNPIINDMNLTQSGGFLASGPDTSASGPGTPEPLWDCISHAH